jgi:hypothetical protein
MPSYFAHSVFLGKGINYFIEIKIFHESCAGISWRKLEFQIVCEVEFAICVPSVLVSLDEGPNTRFFLHGTAVNTSVA